MKSKAHLNLGGVRSPKWGAVKGSISDQHDLIELLSHNASNDDFTALAQRVDDAFAELEEKSNKENVNGSLAKKADLVDGAILDSQLPESIIILQPQIENLALNKLDKIDYKQHFRGVHDSYSKLIEAIPVGNDGDYAHIKESQNFGRLSAIWSGTPGVWNITGINIGSNTDEVPEGNTNLYFKASRVLATLLDGLNNATSSGIVSSDSVVRAFGKLQGQINTITQNLATSVRSTTLLGLNNTTIGIVTAADTVLSAIGKLQAQLGAIENTVRSTTLTGLSFAVNAPINGQDSILSALGKIQAQLSASNSSPMVWVNVNTFAGLTWNAIVDTSKTRFEYCSYQGLIFFRGYITTISPIGSGGGSPLFTHKDARYMCDISFNPNQFSAFILTQTVAGAILGQGNGSITFTQNALGGDNQGIQATGALATGIYHIAPIILGKAKT